MVSPLPLLVLAGTGMATVSVGADWPAVVALYWSRKVAVALLASAEDPSPTRRTTSWPVVNCPSAGPVVKPTKVATTARRRRIDMPISTDARHDVGVPCLGG